MIIIFSDKQDQNSSILVTILLSKQIEFRWITPDNVQSVYSDYTGFAYIKLVDESIFNNVNNFFINRIPNLPANHPLVIFLYMIPYGNILTHPNVASILFSKLHQLKFFESHPKIEILKNVKQPFLKNTCVKSISQIRSFVRQSDDIELFRNGLKHMPVQFQEVAHGFHIKSHVIGSDVYSYCIKADTLDPRESYYQVFTYSITDYIKKSLLEIAHKIGVNYFDCDMIIVKKNVFFLEINSSPAPIVFAEESNDYRVVTRFIDFMLRREYKVNV